MPAPTVLLHVRLIHRERYYTLPLDVLADFRREVLRYATGPVLLLGQTAEAWLSPQLAGHHPHWWKWFMDRTDHAGERSLEHKLIHYASHSEASKRFDYRYFFDYLNPVESVNNWGELPAFLPVGPDEPGEPGSTTIPGNTTDRGFNLFCRLQRYVITDNGEFIPAGTPVKVLGWSEDEEWEKDGRPGRFDNKLIEVQAVRYMYVDMENTNPEQGTIGSGLYFAVRPDNLVYDAEDARSHKLGETNDA